MKKYILLFNTACACMLIGCNQINKEDLVVVDNLHLGQPIEKFYIECDSLGNKECIYLSKSMLTDEDINLRKIAIKANYTERFNIGRYKGANKTHTGVFYINTLEGTDNVIKLTILLGNKGKPYDPGEIIHPDDKDIIYFLDQNVNIKMLEDIKDIIITKYGKPKDTLLTNQIAFYVFEKNEINKYKQTANDIGVMYIWETNALKIKFFTGIKNNKCIYNVEDEIYWQMFEPQNNLNENEIECTSFPYITYEIKPKLYEKLHLNNVKI